MQQALVQNFNWLVTNLSLAGGGLLDRLFEVGCLTEDEYFSVNNRSTESDKCRLLIFKMKNRGPHIIDVFLNILAEDKANVEIVRRVNESLDTLSTRTISQKCFLCLMKATVEIRDVYDDLLTDGLITDELYGEILQSESPQSKKEEFWECVLNVIRDSPDRQQLFKVLERSISKKYDHISSLLETLRNPLDVQCCYCRVPSRRSRHRPRDSFYNDASDISTTSEHADVPDSRRSSMLSVESRGMDDEVQHRDQNRTTQDRLRSRKQKISEARTIILNHPHSLSMVSHKEGSSSFKRRMLSDIDESERHSEEETHEKMVQFAENTDSDETFVKMVGDTTNYPEEVTAYKLHTVDLSLGLDCAVVTDQIKQVNNANVNDSKTEFLETYDTPDSIIYPHKQHDRFQASIKTVDDTRKYASNLDHSYAKLPNTNDRRKLHEPKRETNAHWRPDRHNKHVLEQNVSGQSLPTSAVDDTSLSSSSLRDDNMSDTKKSNLRQIASDPDITETHDVQSTIPYLHAKSTKPDKHSNINKSNLSFAMTVRSVHVQQPDGQSQSSQRSVKSLVSRFENKKT